MKTQNKPHSIHYLLVQICKLRRNKSNELMSEIGMHTGQGGLLYHLSLEDGQTVSSLAEKMCIQQATIFRMIERMAANDLIVKKKDANDKRVSRVYLTDEGKTTYSEVAKIWKVMRKNVVRGLSDDQQSQLRTLLQQVRRNLE